MGERQRGTRRDPSWPALRSSRRANSTRAGWQELGGIERERSQDINQKPCVDAMDIEHSALTHGRKHECNSASRKGRDCGVREEQTRTNDQHRRLQEVMQAIRGRERARSSEPVLLTDGSPRVPDPSLGHCNHRRNKQHPPSHFRQAKVGGGIALSEQRRFLSGSHIAHAGAEWSGLGGVDDRNLHLARAGHRRSCAREKHRPTGPYFPTGSGITFVARVRRNVRGYRESCSGRPASQRT